MTVAETILQQLGGNKFVTMTGVRNLCSLENGLSFKLPSRFANEGINYIQITLNAGDTYDIEFGKVRGLKYGQHYVHKGIGNDNLCMAISQVTGLALSLGTMGRPVVTRCGCSGEVHK